MKKYDIEYCPDSLNESRFKRVLLEIAAEGGKHDNGIGTLSEKMMHSVIKKYLCYDNEYHEVGVDSTKFVADVLIGNEVYEVQTGSFKPLVKKIDYYMKKTQYNVTIVHPIAYKKTIVWMNQTGEEETTHTSSRETFYDVIPELYFLRDYIQCERLHVRLLALEVKEYRTYKYKRNGRRVGVEKIDTVPVKLLGELHLHDYRYYLLFLPPDLPERFCAKDLQKRIPLDSLDVYSLIHTFEKLGLICKTEEGEEKRKASYWKVIG